MTAKMTTKSKNVVKLSASLPHKSSIDLSAKTRSEIAALLNARAADATNLYIHTKLSHWNVRGPAFIALHELFDKAASEISEHADSLAERVAQLGGVTDGTAEQIAKTSILPTFKTGLSKGPEVVAALAKSWAAFANQIRADIDTADAKGDAVTSDLFTQIAGEADKMLWFIEAHLQ